jgi:hypothetical protein
MGGLRGAHLRFWGGLSRRGLCLADPTCDVTFLQLHASFVRSGTRLHLADLDALLVFPPDPCFRELRGAAVNEDGDELPIQLIGACEAETICEKGARRGIGGG